MEKSFLIANLIGFTLLSLGALLYFIGIWFFFVKKQVLNYMNETEIFLKLSVTGAGLFSLGVAALLIFNKSYYGIVIFLPILLGVISFVIHFLLKCQNQKYVLSKKQDAVSMTVF